jgi:anti-anti-sigma factor
MTGGPQPFSYEVESDPSDTTILRLHGELDMGSSSKLADVLHELQQGGGKRIVVDLRGLSLLDSMGLSALLEAHMAGQNGHGEVSFIRGQDSIQRVFAVTGMHKRVSWVDPS